MSGKGTTIKSLFEAFVSAGEIDKSSQTVAEQLFAIIRCQAVAKRKHELSDLGYLMTVRSGEQINLI